MSNGKYDVQGANNLARQVYQTNPEKMEKAKQVVEMCAKEGNKSMILWTVDNYSY